MTDITGTTLFSDGSPVPHNPVLQFDSKPPAKGLPFFTVLTRDPSLFGRQNLPSTATVLTTGRTTVMACKMVCTEYHYYSKSEHIHTHTNTGQANSLPSVVRLEGCVQLEAWGEKENRLITEC